VPPRPRGHTAERAVPSWRSSAVEQRAVQARIDAFAENYARAFPAAVKCLLADRQQLTSYLRFPLDHIGIEPQQSR